MDTEYFYAFIRKTVVMIIRCQAAELTFVSTDTNQIGNSNHSITIQLLYSVKNQMNK